MYNVCRQVLPAFSITSVFPSVNSVESAVPVSAAPLRRIRLVCRLPLGIGARVRRTSELPLMFPRYALLATGKQTC